MIIYKKILSCHIYDGRRKEKKMKRLMIFTLNKVYFVRTTFLLNKKML